LSVLDQVDNWREFERLCADLLASEGFLIDAEPSVDSSGTDIVVTEEYRSHDPSRVIRVKWRVQCKHYARSGRNLGRREVEEAITAFEATRSPDEGLFLIVSSDYTEPARRVIDRYVATRPSAKVTIWNRRQLIAKLERHPELLTRYGVSLPSPDYLSALSPVARFSPATVLLISDQSPFAHNLARALRRNGFEVVFVPFWNYHSPVRLRLILETYRKTSIKLIVCFLGESFGLPMPGVLVDYVVQCHRMGTPLLLFPFIAWSMSRKLYAEFKDLCPVELIDPTIAETALEEEKFLGAFRRGDFRWLASFDSFAEDRYVEFDPSHGRPPFSDEVQTTFGLSHTFESLSPCRGANVTWSDTSGNPLLVTKKTDSSRVCYVNSCCHACMSIVPVSSPLEVSPEFAISMRNVLIWLLGEGG
jgi:hypothetical protein